MSVLEETLLDWFGMHQINDYVSVENFDREYCRLAGKRPLWYSWGPFYRDHGLVGLRHQIGVLGGSS